MGTQIAKRAALSAGDTVSAPFWIAEARRVNNAIEHRTAIGEYQPGTTEYYAYATGVLLACANGMADMLEKALANGGAR